MKRAEPHLREYVFAVSRRHDPRKPTKACSRPWPPMLNAAASPRRTNGNMAFAAAADRRCLGERQRLPRATDGWVRELQSCRARDSSTCNGRSRVFPGHRGGSSRRGGRWRRWFAGSPTRGTPPPGVCRRSRGQAPAGGPGRAESGTSTPGPCPGSRRPSIPAAPLRAQKARVNPALRSCAPAQTRLRSWDLRRATRYAPRFRRDAPERTAIVGMRNFTSQGKTRCRASARKAEATSYTRP